MQEEQLSLTLQLDSVVLVKRSGGPVLLQAHSEVETASSCGSLDSVVEDQPSQSASSRALR